MNEAWCTYEWVRTPIPRLEICDTYEWVMIHTWMSQSTHMNKSWHTYQSTRRGNSRTHNWHFICVPWLIYMCATIHSYCHDSFIRSQWFIHICSTTHSYVCRDSFVCVSWLIHMCAMIRSYVWHDSFATGAPTNCMPRTYTSHGAHTIIPHVWVMAHTQKHPLPSEWASNSVPRIM